MIIFKKDMSTYLDRQTIDNRYCYYAYKNNMLFAIINSENDTKAIRLFKWSCK